MEGYSSQMKRASVTEVKNGLSALLDQVKSGETIVITDRGIPVARIVPEAGGTDADADEARISRLERAGVLRRATAKMPLELILSPLPKLAQPAYVVEALLEERREGR